MAFSRALPSSSLSWSAPHQAWSKPETKVATFPACSSSLAGLHVRALATKMKSKGKGPGKQGFGSGSGFGSKPASGKPAVDSLALLRRSEQLYVKLLEELHKASNSNRSSEWDQDDQDDSTNETVIREYIICARGTQTSKGGGGTQEATKGVLLPDWLPVAELLLVSDGDASVDMPQALPFVCREVGECAGLVLGASFPRHILEFAFEGAESFYDEVAPTVLGFRSLTSDNGTGTCPYTALGVPKGAPLSQIRAAYRKLAAEHHPDRHEEHLKDEAEGKFKAITTAYDQIRSSSGASIQGSLSGSYAALGGPKRQGISNPLTVRPSREDETLPERIRVAVRALDPELVEVFLARMARRPV